MNRTSTLDTYHLYHRHPSPLPEHRIGEGAWLVNNGSAYRRVAAILARSPEEAWQSGRDAAAGRGKRRRFVQPVESRPLRESLPGDVLVGERAAWMGTVEGGLRPFFYGTSRSSQTIRLDRFLQSVAFSPAGGCVAVAGSEVSLHTLHDEEDPRLGVTSYRRHGNWTVHAAAWSPDGAYIASGGHESEVHVWRQAPHSGPGRASRGPILICRTDDLDAWRLGVSCIAWGTDSRSLYAARGNGDVVCWDARSGTCLWVTSSPLPGDASALALSPDGTRAVAGSRDGTLGLWWSETGTLIGTLKQSGEVTAAAWSPDGSLLAIAGDEESASSLAVWGADAVESAQRATIPLSTSFTAAPCARWLAWSPSGGHLAAGCVDGTVQVLDVAAQRHVLTYRVAPQCSVVGLAWSPGGEWIAAADTHRPSGSLGALRVWPVAADLSCAAARGGEGI